MFYVIRVLLSRVEYAINNSVHSTTKFTPCQLLYGVHQRGQDIDSLSEYLTEKQPISRELDTLRRTASENIVKSQQHASDLHVQKHKPHITFELGDYVVIRNVDTTVGTNKKFIPKYKGPYYIHRVLPNDRYVVRDIENYQVTQLPYDGIIEASRMRRWADWREYSVDDTNSEK